MKYSGYVLLFPILLVIILLATISTFAYAQETIEMCVDFQDWAGREAIGERFTKDGFMFNSTGNYWMSVHQISGDPVLYGLYLADEEIQIDFPQAASQVTIRALLNEPLRITAYNCENGVADSITSSITETIQTISLSGVDIVSLQIESSTDEAFLVDICIEVEGVNLIAPEDGATCVATSDIAFSWSEVACANGYHWVLSATADLSSPIATKTRLITTATTYTGTLDYNTRYYWHVTAYWEGRVIGTSTISTFTTVAAEGADVNLIAPDNEATCVATYDVAFSWSEVASADEYEWVLSATADLSSPIATEGLTATTTTYTGPPLDYDTRYYWHVTAYREGCVMGASTIGTFTTVAAPIIESVDPSEGRRGSVIELNVLGVNFEEGSRIFIAEGVEVLEASFISSEHLVATIRITEDAPLGPQPVIVQGPGPTLDGEVAEVSARAALLDEGFTVIKPPGPIPISVPIAGGVAVALTGTLATHKVMKSRRRQKWQREAEENPQEVCEPGTKCCQKIESKYDLSQCQIEYLRLTAYNAVSGKLSEEKQVRGKIVDGLNMVIAASRQGEKPEKLKKQIMPLAQALLQSIMDWLYEKRGPQNVSITGHLEGCKVTYKFKLKECKETRTWGEAKEEWEVKIKEERDEPLSVLQGLESSIGISEQLTAELTLRLVQFIEKV